MVLPGKKAVGMVRNSILAVMKNIGFLGENLRKKTNLS